MNQQPPWMRQETTYRDQSYDQFYQLDSAKPTGYPYSYTGRPLIPPPPPLPPKRPAPPGWLLWMFLVLLVMGGIGEGVYTYYLVQQPKKQSTPIVTMPLPSVTKIVTSTPTPARYTAQDVYNAFVKNQVPINSHYDDKLITVTWREVGFPAQSTSGMLLNDASIGFSDSWPLGIYVFSQESDVQQDVAAIIDANTPGPHMSGPYYFYAHHRCLLIGDQRMSLNTIAPYEKVMMNACL